MMETVMTKTQVISWFSCHLFQQYSLVALNRYAIFHYSQLSNCVSALFALSLLAFKRTIGRIRYDHYAAVHITKYYCLSSLLFGYEIWCENRAALSIQLESHQVTFGKICCWRESPKLLLYYCKTIANHTYG